MATLITAGGAGVGTLAPLAIREFADVKTDDQGNEVRRELIGALGSAGTPSALFGLAWGAAGVGTFAAREFGVVGKKTIPDDIAMGALATGVPALGVGAFSAVAPKKGDGLLGGGDDGGSGSN